MRIMAEKKGFFWKAFICSCVFGVLFLIGGVVWETNDDEAIAFLLSRVENDYSPFQWRLLSIVVHYLYVYNPRYNWWMVVSAFFIWISSFIVSYIILKRYKGKMKYLLVIFLLLFLWIVAVYRVNFTRTAAVVSMAGALLIADGIFDEIKIWNRWLKYGAGCLLLLAGASIRSRCGMIALFFLAIIGFVRLIESDFSLSMQWIKNQNVKIIMLAFSAIIFFSVSYVDSLFLTTEQKNYLKYNALRSAIQDYRQNYPSYEEAIDIYTEAGMDERTLNLFFRWFSEDVEVFDEETLRTIGEIAEKRVDMTILWNLLESERQILASVAILLVIFILYNKKNWKQIGVVSSGLLLCSIYLTINGRFPSRVFESLLWCFVCSVVFLSKDTRSDSLEDKMYRKSVWGIIALFAIAICLGGIHVTTVLYLDGEGREKIYQHQTYASKRVCLDLINEDTGNLYIFDIYSQPLDMESAFSCWEGKPTKYCKNRFVLGGWEVRHPYFVELQTQFGIENPATALYEKLNVYSMYSGRVLTHLRNHYNNRITVSETKVLGDYSLVQYSAPIDDALLIYDTDINANISQFYYCEKEEGAWFICSRVDSLKDGTDVYYCNITVNGVRYTYRLGFAEGNVFAYLHGLEKEFCLANADIKIFQLTKDKKYVSYNINYAVE